MWTKYHNRIAWFLTAVLVVGTAGLTYFNAFPVRTVQASTQNRTPTSDENNTGSFTTSPLWSKMNDASDATLIVGVNNTGGHASFGFTAFSVPAGAIISKLSIHYRCRSTTTSTAQICASNIKVGGTYYGSGDTAGGDAGSGAPSSAGAISDRTFDFTTNPKTGLSWTIAEINGTDVTNPLQAFGVGSNDYNPDVNFYDVDATVTYSSPPTVALNTPADAATGQSTTPTLNFTGTDADSDTLEYNVQIGTDNAFTSTSYTVTDTYTGDNGTSRSFGDTTFIGAGQTIVPGSSYSLGKIEFNLSKHGSPVDNLYVEVADALNGTVLGTSSNIAGSSLTTFSTRGYITFTFSTPIALTSGATYWVRLIRTGSLDASNYYDMWGDGTYANGNVILSNAGTWQNAGGDGNFKTYAYNAGSLLLNKFSASDTGFTAGHPFASGAAKDFTVQAGDALTSGLTYYWRVAAIDPSGSNTYGAWSSTRSFTVGAVSTTDTNTHVYINTPSVILNSDKIIFN